jgi:hypothetical protein
MPATPPVDRSAVPCIARWLCCAHTRYFTCALDFDLYVRACRDAGAIVSFPSLHEAALTVPGKVCP